MNPKPLYLVAGARPNFIKLAPLVKTLKSKTGLPFQVIHTGQHYDDALSASFFRTLGIPEPDINLEVGSARHGVQTARILERFEALLLDTAPSAVVVFGDVNSTLACSIAASKLQVPIVHVEAGLRSFDRTMPEEINRIVTDALSDLLMVSESSGLVNLGNEGIALDKIHFVGNIMIDSLQHMLPLAEDRRTHERYGLKDGEYIYLTMHRPSNVDHPEILSCLLHLFDQVSTRIPILFAVHPRTRKMLADIGKQITDYNPTFIFTEPLDYLDSLCLQKFARAVLTDSGGIQEESSVLGIPCLTLRENTERPVTIELGTSTLVGNNIELIRKTLDKVLSGDYKKGQPLPLWDGHAAERISTLLEKHFGI